MFSARARYRRLIQLLAGALLTAASFGSATAQADTLDDVLNAMVTYGGLDPAIVDAREMIDCVVKHGGDATACFNIQTEAEKQAGKAAQAWMPDDPKVRAVVDLVGAVDQGRWFTVIDLAGFDILLPLICDNALRAGGPVGKWICSGPFQSITKEFAAPVVREAFSILVSGDSAIEKIFRLITLVASVERACALIPFDFPGKDEACSVLGQLIAEIGGAFVEAGKYGAKLVVEGTDAVEDLLLGSDAHMSYDAYYGRYWLPWMHKSVSLCLGSGCAGVGKLHDSIWDRCVDYFDNHNQYKSTAKKTCTDLRNRYEKAHQLLVTAISRGAQSYTGELRPGARSWAVTEYGKHDSAALRSHFLTLCETELAQGYPLGEWKPEWCSGFASSSNPLIQSMHPYCLEAVNERGVNPTAWRQACSGAVPAFEQMLSEERSNLDARIAEMTSAGCKVPAGWSASQGLRFECSTYAGYDLCHQAIVAGANSICRIDRAAADLARAKEIQAYLGSRRCTREGTRVHCTRPWKRAQCEQLSRATPRLQASKSTLSCTAETAEYDPIAAESAALVGKLNTVIARGGNSAQCQQLEDGAKIRCLRMDVLQQRLEADASLERSPCPADLDFDGADRSCLLIPEGFLGFAQPASVTAAKPVPPMPPQSSAEPRFRGSEGELTRATDIAPAAGTDRPAPEPVGERAALPTAATPLGAPPNPCALDVRYYVPETPILLANSGTPQAGDQVQIQCRFSIRTSRLEWPRCEDADRRSMALIARSQASAGRFSGIVSIDGNTVGVASSPTDGGEFERTSLWSFKEPGQHEVRCAVDNALRYAVREAPVYLETGLALEVQAQAGSWQYRRFEPAGSRTVEHAPVELQATPVFGADGPRLTGAAPSPGPATTLASARSALNAAAALECTYQPGPGTDQARIYTVSVRNLSAEPLGPGAVSFRFGFSGRHAALPVTLQGSLSAALAPGATARVLEGANAARLPAEPSSCQATLVGSGSP